MFKTKKHIKNYEQAVSALPEIYKFPVSQDMEFIVIGCDGIWDCVTPQILCDYISASLKEKLSIKNILKKIFDIFISKHPDGKLHLIVARIGSDNMTCIILEFNH